MIEKHKREEKFNEYREFDFENGIKFVFRVLNDEPSLRFIDKDGKDLVDLLEFVPAGTVLELGDRWIAGEIVGGGTAITVGKFSNPSDAILSFFHEAGHLNDIENARRSIRAREKYSEELGKDKANNYTKERLRSMAEAKKADIVAERNAWAFALKKTREIERQLGIKIFDKLSGGDIVAQKAKIFVDAYLGTYEKRYLDELYDLQIYTKEEMEKFFEDLLKDEAA